MKSIPWKKHAIPLSLLVLMACTLVWRSFQGFDWTDETYYAAISYRIVQGDPMFLASWDIHQLSGMLEAPIVWLYVTVSGGAEGIILYLRVVYVLFGCATASLMYVAVVDYAGRCCAVLASVLPVICMNPIALSYNSMQLLSFCFSCSILLLSVKRTGMVKDALFVFAGFFSGTGVIAYPTTIIALPVFVGLVLLEPAFGCSKRTRLRHLCLYAAGGLCCFSVGTAVGILDQN